VYSTQTVAEACVVTWVIRLPAPMALNVPTAEIGIDTLPAPMKSDKGR